MFINGRKKSSLSAPETTLFHFLELFSGMLSGLVVAGSLNWWDRGLYLSIKERRPFLDRRNFQRPFQGLSQTIFQRAFSHGIYFPLEKYFVQFTRNLMGDGTMANGCGGICAGALNAFLLNPLAATKYTFWGNDGNRQLRREIRDMYRKGGLRQFKKGLTATVTRDILFGATFSILRHGQRNTLNLSGAHVTRQSEDLGISETEYRKILRVAIDLNSAFVACVVSAPFNYVRNMQYATPKHSTNIVSAMTLLRGLYNEGLERKVMRHRYQFWSSRLRFGWGTGRVAVGMALTSFFWEVSEFVIGLEDDTI